MKKLLLSAGILAAGLFANQAKAQDNVVKVNVLSPMVKTASLFYERAISENKSVQLGFFYTGFEVTDTKFSGFGITPEMRFYFGDKGAPAGFYVAPFARYQNFTLTTPSIGYYNANGEFVPSTKDDEATLSTIGGGVIGGKHWIFGERFSLDIFAGPQINAGSVEVKSGNESSFSTGSFDGFGIRTGVTIGLAF
jgi:hypothetical protein